MKLKPKHVSLLLIFLGVVSLLSGCSARCSESGDQKLPASWTAIGFPVVEGAEICACGKYATCDEYIEITHKTDSPLTLVDEYSQKLKVSGWTVEPVGNSRESLWATKDNVRLELFFHECFKSFTKPGTWSSCEDLGVTRKSK